MSQDAVSRSLIRHGFIVMLLGFLTGFGIVAGGPHARGWMGTHITLMITALFIVVTGLVWSQLRLSRWAGAVLRFALLFDGYWSAAAGAFGTLWAIQGPATGHGPQASGWPVMVFFTVFIPVLTVLPFIAVGLILYGLRARSE
jgi:hypothetical protein